jgi:hypothetical protein
MYVLALSIGFGGAITIGLVVPPLGPQVFRRFFLILYISDGILLVSLLAMGLLGPRPSGFAARFGVAAILLATTLYAGREAGAFSPVTLATVMTCGLVLLFWEARDGTRAA